MNKIRFTFGVTLLLCMSFGASSAQDSFSSSSLNSNFSTASADISKSCVNGTYAMIEGSFFSCSRSVWVKKEADIPKGHICGFGTYGAVTNHASCKGHVSSAAKPCPTGYRISVMSDGEKKQLGGRGNGYAYRLIYSASYCSKI